MGNGCQTTAVSNDDGKDSKLTNNSILEQKLKSILILFFKLKFNKNSWILIVFYKLKSHSKKMVKPNCHFKPRMPFISLCQYIDKNFMLVAL